MPRESEMSTAIYLSGNDEEPLPRPYPLFDSEPRFPESKGPPSIPVFTHLSIPSSLVPSILGASSRGVPHPEASSPPSSHSDSSSEISDGFRYHGGYPSSTISSSRAKHKNSFDFELGCAQDVKSDFPSGSSTASTSLTSSHDHFQHFQQLPVWLPIEAPEWMCILASLPNDDNEETEEFARMVEEDSRRVACLKKLEVLRK